MRRAISIALAFLAASPAAAAPADVAAALAMPGRSAAAVALDEGRKPAEVLAFLGLERGDHALDLFTGGGYYAELMAKAVGPEGSVVAWQPAISTTTMPRLGQPSRAAPRTRRSL